MAWPILDYDDHVTDNKNTSPTRFPSHSKFNPINGTQSFSRGVAATTNADANPGANDISAVRPKLNHQYPAPKATILQPSRQTNSNASIQAMAPVDQQAVAKKLEAQKKTDALRAKLLAQRQPIPPLGRSDSQSKHPQLEPPNKLNSHVAASSEMRFPHEDHPSVLPEMVDRFFNERPFTFTNTGTSASSTLTVDSAKLTNNTIPRPIASPKETTLTALPPISTPGAFSRRMENKMEENAIIPTVETDPVVTAPPRSLNDEYYNDLAVWLNMTGYHDVQFRDTKLRSYKERCALETEALIIQTKLDLLKEKQQADTTVMRAQIGHSSSAATGPPLPSTLPSDQNTPATNSLKRKHISDSSPPYPSTRRHIDTDAPTGHRTFDRRDSVHEDRNRNFDRHPDPYFRHRSIDIDRYRPYSNESRPGWYDRDRAGTNDADNNNNSRKKSKGYRRKWNDRQQQPQKQKR